MRPDKPSMTPQDIRPTLQMVRRRVVLRSVL
jgi:hypothetical protein